MLGATLVILSLIALAWYVAKVGTMFTLLFIGAVAYMTYKRLPLIAFTIVFTLLLAAYTALPWIAVNTAMPWHTPASGVWQRLTQAGRRVASSRRFPADLSSSRCPRPSRE